MSEIANDFLAEVRRYFPGAYITDIRDKEEEPVVDLSPSKFEPFSLAFQAFLDHAMETAAMEREPRTYLGGSRLGEDCTRRLAYEYTHAPVDKGKHFNGNTLRIFDMGHDCETRNASYLRQAGFTLLTERADGRQFGFYIARDPVTGEPRIAGHTDGIITAGPAYLPVRRDDNGVYIYDPNSVDFPMVYPLLWENKGLNAKGWRSCLSKGVEKAKPIYYVQMQVYMHHLELTANRALFTATNRDSGGMYAELVPFDAPSVQAALDKGVKVITAQSPEELPRIGANPDAFACKWCPYVDRCWSAPAASSAAAAPMPGWMAAPKSS